MLLQYHHIFLRSSYSTIKIIICDIEKLLQCHPIFVMAPQHCAKKFWHIPYLPVQLWAAFGLNCKLELTFGISKCQCKCSYTTQLQLNMFKKLKINLSWNQRSLKILIYNLEKKKKKQLPQIGSVKLHIDVIILKFQPSSSLLDESIAWSLV